MSGPTVSLSAPEHLVYPEETPECESSTCHSISIHDPVHAHDVWWNWAGLFGIAMLVLFAVGFMAARMIAM